MLNRKSGAFSRTVRRAAVTIALGATTLTACTPTTTASPSAVANPNMARRCGIDVNLVIDRSNSVAANIDNTVAAAQGFVDSMASTGSRVRVASFGGFGAAHPDGQETASYSWGTFGWSSAAGFTVPSLRQISGPYGPEFPDRGSTNMEAGLEVVRRAPGPVGDLTLVFSDGEPNEHNLNTPDGLPGPNVNLGKAHSEAIAEANRLKSAGSHILAVGVTGWGGITVPTLQSISGPDRVGDVPIDEADYVDLDSFGDVGPALDSIAQQLCRSSLTIQKFIGGDGEYLPFCGARFAALADPEPTQWFGNPDKMATCGPSPTGTPQWGGTTSIAWDPSAPSTALTIPEAPSSTSTLESATCTRSDPAGGAPIPVPVDSTMIAEQMFSLTVGEQDAVYCKVYNRILDAPPGYDNLILRTEVADPATGPTGIRASVTGNSTSNVATPGSALFVVGTSPVIQLSTLEAGWYLQSLVCDGVTMAAPSYSQPTFVPGQTHVCTLVVSRTPTIATVGIRGFYTAEVGPALPISWKMTFPAGTSSTLPGYATANGLVGGGFSPSMVWGVAPGTPYVLTPVSADPFLTLVSFQCATPMGYVGTVAGATLTLAAGDNIKCYAGYERQNPASVRITSAIKSLPDGAGPYNYSWSAGITGQSGLALSSTTDLPLDWTNLVPGTYDLTALSDDPEIEFGSLDCTIFGQNGGGNYLSTTSPVTIPLGSGQFADCVAHYQYVGP